MSKTKGLWSVYVGALMLCLMFTTEASAGDDNIVLNPGFEEMNGGNPKGWEGLPKNWIVDREVAHSGKNSLCIRNSDPACYTNPHCALTPELGGTYNASVWVKLEDVKNGGATFSIEYWGKNNEYLGGTWNTPRLSGTTGDWRRLILENFIIPKTRTDHVSFTVFLDRGATGTVWFDDIEIKKVSSSVFETFLLYPNYRSWILPGKKEAEIEVELNPKLLNCELKDLRLNAVLKATPSGSMLIKDSKVIKEKKWAPPPSEKFVASIDISDIPPGKYELLICLQDKADKIIDIDTYQLKKLSDKEFSELETYFDENSVCYVKGKPYFPLGWYTCEGEYENGKKHLKCCNPEEISSGGPFNTVIFYGGMRTELLDDLQAYGVRIIGGAPIGPFTHGEKRLDPAVRIKEEIDIKNQILKFKDHPAILGWYINDEVPTNDECYPSLIDHYKWISETDPAHPTYTVQMNLGDLKSGAFVTDVIGVDPYPIRGQEITWVSEMTEKAVEAGHGKRPVWTVLQAHPTSAYVPNWKEIPPEKKLADAPTRQEVHCMTYLAVISGAKGLFYYSFFDIKNHLSDFPERLKWHKAIAGEIAKLSPVIFSAEDTGKLKITCADKDIRFLLKKLGDKYYLMTANGKNEKKNADFGIAGMDNIKIVDYLNNNHAVTVGNNTFSQEYEPYGVRVYLIQGNGTTENSEKNSKKK